jgi:2,4-dichlorophenol 6-monooxygenase
VPLRTLAHEGHFVLVAGEEGHDWIAAAQTAAEERDLPLRATRIGFGDVDHVDIQCAWLKHRAISATGAILVRPDGHVAFRAPEAVVDPLGALAAALDQILPKADAAARSEDVLVSIEEE